MNTEQQIHALYLELLKIAVQAKVELSPSAQKAMKRWIRSYWSADPSNLRIEFEALLAKSGGVLKSGDFPRPMALELKDLLEVYGDGTIEAPISTNSRPSIDVPPNQPDPPRKSFGLVNAPDWVVVGREFPIIVGLSPTAQPGVIGAEMTRPDSSVGPYRLTIQLVAAGFRIRQSGSRRTLQVTAKKPFPRTIFHLTAEPQEAPIRSTTIQVFFSIEGQTLGAAFRPIAVVREGAAPPGVPTEVEPGIELPPADPLSIPDLTIRISTPENDGKLLWTFETRFANLAVPTEPLRTNLGREPDQFTRVLDDRLRLKEGQPGLDAFLSGLGETISDAMPVEFWPLFSAVAVKTSGRPPWVLLLSQEPHVPWELAKVDGAKLDPAAPSRLGAQARVGRWILGNRRPTLPPPIRHRVESMAVISGSSGGNHLDQADQEANELAEWFGASRVPAFAKEVALCLEGESGVDLLHFAVHGLHDPEGTYDGLILADGRTLDPLEVRGRRLDHAPFVFLNACQAGAGHHQLGHSAGLAASFLAAGASAVVAPLWSVRDHEARRIALDFYRTVKSGMRPAEALRSACRSSPDQGSASHLAYQFFGHPGLLLEFSSNGSSHR